MIDDIVVQGKRSGVQSVAVLITDGQSSTDTVSVVAEAMAAHEACIQIFAIGVSSLVNTTELQLIASTPRIYYHQWWTVGNLASLSSIEAVVAGELCRPDYGTCVTNERTRFIEHSCS